MTDAVESDSQPSKDPFLFVRMTGPSFEGEGMPATAMPEIQALAEALYEVARQEWLNEHPGRSRLPAGFAELFDLRLVAVDEGSAKPRLVLKRRTSSTRDQHELDEMYAAMDRAPAALTGLLAHARDDHRAPPGLPEKHFALIAKIGRALGDSDAIEIAPPAAPGAATPVPVVLNLEVRNTLKAIDDALKDRPEPTEISLEGVVTEFDGRQQSFMMRAEGHPGLVSCRIAGGEFTLAKKIKTVLAEDGVTAPDVRVQGWAQNDARGRLEGLHDVIAVEVVRTFKEKRLLARIDLLEHLEDGWAERHSLKPEAGVLAALRQVERDVSELEIMPELAARTDGSVAFEVSLGDLHCVAVIEQAGQQMYLLADDDSDDPAEFEGPFSSGMLVNFLRTGATR